MEKYKKYRIFIAVILILEVILILKIIIFCNWNLSLISGFPIEKFLFGILAGILGLLLRDFVWLFGIKTENQPGKNLWLTYLFQYQLFTILSSILISSVLMLNGTIENSSYLFFTFALPLNIYIGLEAYQALDFLKGIVGKSS